MPTALNLAIAAFLSLNPPADLGDKQCLKDCRVSEIGQMMERSLEGYAAFPYKDAAGKDTIGYGHLVQAGEHFILPVLPPEAEKLYQKDSARIAAQVNKSVGVRLWQKQFDALHSFTYNLGAANLQRSTLLKRVNTEQHYEVPPQFLRWIYAGGQKIKGLEFRRESEAELYAEAL